MRKNLFSRLNSLYISLFVLAGTVVQAAPSRALDPDAPSWTWEGVQRVLIIARRAFDVLKFPIG